MKWLCKIFGHKVNRNESVLWERVGGEWFRYTAICKRCGEKYTKITGG
jgi:hypothetical protein